MNKRLGLWIGLLGLLAMLALGEQALAEPPGLPHWLWGTVTLDGLLVDEILHDARETLLYRVHNPHNSQPLVLKTLQPSMEGDLGATAALLMEEWRARRGLRLLRCGVGGRR